MSSSNQTKSILKKRVSRRSSYSERKRAELTASSVRNVSFNEETLTYKYESIYDKRGNQTRHEFRNSLWYNKGDFIQFHGDYRSDLIGKRWIKKQKMKNNFEIAWRSTPLRFLGKEVTETHFESVKSEKKPFISSNTLFPDLGINSSLFFPDLPIRRRSRQDPPATRSDSPADERQEVLTIISEEKENNCSNRISSLQPRVVVDGRHAKSYSSNQSETYFDHRRLLISGRI
jgi:hypothetical protein